MPGNSASTELQRAGVTDQFATLTGYFAVRPGSARRGRSSHGCTSQSCGFTPPLAGACRPCRRHLRYCRRESSMRLYRADVTITVIGPLLTKSSAPGGYGVDSVCAHKAFVDPVTRQLLTDSFCPGPW